MTHSPRLIEDYLPIQAISAEAAREKSVRKGHISTLHLWWARRPLVACRAAVYGALVPADRWVGEVNLKHPPADPDKAERVKNGKKLGLNRTAAAKFVTALCKYPGDRAVIAQAETHILEAHADRLTAELEEAAAGTAPVPAWVEEFKFTGAQVAVDDIRAGRAPRPRVLDMFAGGGAIPLEALRLGCEAYALDLNPVAHIIELCTLVYPQKYGKPDPETRGMTGEKNAKGESTWGGLAEEVRYWGNWVLDKVRAEIGDLYPPIPDPEAKQVEIGGSPQKMMDFAKDPQRRMGVPQGYLTPVAYLWTRTVACKNPACGATVPLARQTWLCKKKDRYVALNMVPDKKTKRVRFQVVESASEKGLGFDPAEGSKGGNATCPFCGTVADSDYVKAEGCAGRMGQQMMAIVCTRQGKQGKVYISADTLPQYVPSNDAISARIDALCQRTGLTVPDEPIITDAKNSCWTYLYGLDSFGDLFSPRQLLCLLSFTAVVRAAEEEMKQHGAEPERSKGVLSYLAVLVDRIADKESVLARWDNTRENSQGTFGRQALPMVWDFVEPNPLGEASGGADGALAWIAGVVEAESMMGLPAHLARGSATSQPWPDASLDAVVTDPPYYDNVPYADISDFFYVWLRRSVGHLYPEHFASEGTPKKSEAVADATRYGGSKDKARKAYEDMMARSFAEAHRVLKPNGEMVVVYAHKTTLGWSTLVDALRTAGFNVTEAWPLDTEMAGRLRAMDSAALASSIFLVARKREGASTAEYETAVRPELEMVVRERVNTLWEMGISGADLLIASVGAGLRAFTRFARVEYANGEEVPAERFLSEVETVVLETILSRLSKEVGGNGGAHGLAGVDPATRFYLLWRYTYRTGELDAGEAIVFANGTHVELDGPGSLGYGARALVEKKKAKYRLLDFTQRGDEEKLGLPDAQTGQPAPLVDALHRVLWLMEHAPLRLAEYLQESGVDREQLRLVAHAIAGPVLKGGDLTGFAPSAELSALNKLTANWRSVVEEATLTPLEREGRRTGQKSFKFDKE